MIMSVETFLAYSHVIFAKQVEQSICERSQILSQLNKAIGRIFDKTLSLGKRKSQYSSPHL